MPQKAAAILNISMDHRDRYPGGEAEYRAVSRQFERLKGYKDSSERVTQCGEAVAEKYGDGLLASDLLPVIAEILRSDSE